MYLCAKFQIIGAFEIHVEGLNASQTYLFSSPKKVRYHITCTISHSKQYWYITFFKLNLFTTSIVIYVSFISFCGSFVVFFLSYHVVKVLKHSLLFWVLLIHVSFLFPQWKCIDILKPFSFQYEKSFSTLRLITVVVFCYVKMSRWVCLKFLCGSLLSIC